ncbi:hypothetical protein U9M48_040896 [Paspalum notatum var. saurae]|uniref:Uncharacterized protein n=1 Tax=Paspalum notatum var. saurae TaxID=547442 RepID=A0AAQ3URJ0_PASNO
MSSATAAASTSFAPHASQLVRPPTTTASARRVADAALALPGPADNPASERRRGIRHPRAHPPVRRRCRRTGAPGLGVAAAPGPSTSLPRTAAAAPAPPARPSTPPTRRMPPTATAASATRAPAHRLVTPVSSLVPPRPPSSTAGIDSPRTREHPANLKEDICSVIFAGPKCSELPELGLG